MSSKEADMEVDYWSDYDAESGALDYELTIPPDDGQMKKIMRLVRTLKIDELKEYLKESNLDLTKARLKKNNQSLLFYCFDIGNEEDCLKALKILVSDFRLNPKRSDDIQQTLLFYACREGYNIVIDWLIDTYKLSVNRTDMYGQTPIYYAWSKGQKSTLLKLIDLKADCWSTDLENQTPLFFAARNGHTEIAKFYLRKVAL